MPRVVGILGGMGPAATVDLMQRMIRLCPGKSDQDGMRMLVDNNPLVPDRNKAIANTGPSPGPILAAMAQGLETQGADFLVMACNTAHAFEASIRDAVRVPFISMIDETVAAASAVRPKRIALLAAAGCLDAQLYQRAFEAQGIETIVPEGEVRQSFMRLLYEIKAGDTGPSVRRNMKTLARHLSELGGEVVIAGCTEVPLVLGQEDLDEPFIDSTQQLARAAVDIAYGVRGLPA